MRPYPTVATTPSRKMRKNLRGVVFAENKAEGKRLRAERKEKRRAERKEG